MDGILVTLWAALQSHLKMFRYFHPAEIILEMLLKGYCLNQRFESLAYVRETVGKLWNKSVQPNHIYSESRRMSQASETLPVQTLRKLCSPGSRHSVCDSWLNINDSVLLKQAGTRWLQRQTIITNVEIVAENHENERWLWMITWPSETPGRAITADHLVCVTCCCWLSKYNSTLPSKMLKFCKIHKRVSWVSGVSKEANVDTFIVWTASAAAEDQLGLNSTTFPLTPRLHTHTQKRTQRQLTEWPRPAAAAAVAAVAGCDGARGR